MKIYDLPDILFNSDEDTSSELNIFNYEVNSTAHKNKINLNQNVLSFLVEGKKEVHFSNKSVSIDPNQSLLMASGNFLMTEHIGKAYFRCLLFFFSKKNVSDFLLKYGYLIADKKTNTKPSIEPYFLIDKDQFIANFINSLTDNFNLQKSISKEILVLKFEEIMFYLLNKYKHNFLNYLKSLIIDERELSFKVIIDKNIYTNLSLEEIAFLCNMSLSSFKRKFADIYQTSPGKWFQQKRLHKAKEILSNDKLKPSEIFMDFGYNSLSNFSAAFKKEFGYSPNQAQQF